MVPTAVDHHSGPPVLLRQLGRFGLGVAGTGQVPVGVEERRVALPVVGRVAEGGGDSERPQLRVVGQDPRQVVAAGAASRGAGPTVTRLP